MQIAPSGVIEYIPKNDPQINFMLTLRSSNIFYPDLSDFEKIIKSYAKIDFCKTITKSNRKLFCYSSFTHI